MDIGGIHISVDSKAGAVGRPPEPAYQCFMDSDSSGGLGASRISVTLETGNGYDVSGMDTLFDSGGSWFMMRDGEDRLISLKPPEFDDPVWMARMAGNCRDVTVYCGRELIRDDRHGQHVSSPVCYPLDQILIMYFLSTRNGALLHAAGAEINGKGVVFPGKSGAGKSTLCAYLSGIPEIGMLSDDRIIARQEGGRFAAYGTPWPGEAGIAENRRVPLCGLMFIRHGTAHRITPISSREAMERLMPVTSIPWFDKPVLASALGFCEALAQGVPAYELEFSLDRHVGDVIMDIVQEIDGESTDNGPGRGRDGTL